MRSSIDALGYGAGHGAPICLRRRDLLQGALATGLAAGTPGFAGAASDAIAAPIRAKAESFSQLHAIVVVHRGETVLAEAFRGPAISRLANVKSVSKTLVATLAGIAISRGALEGTEQPVAPFLAPFMPQGGDRRLQAITVGDLLTMRAGLARTSGAAYGAFVESPNWLAHALSRPFTADPGSRFQYSTGSYHLMGAVLTRATGQSLHALARAWLAGPLDIAMPPWTRDPQGYYLGGNNMALSPIGLARFGEAWRQGGQLDGDEIVPAAWVEAAWTPRTRSPFSGDDYGYGWFLTRLGGSPAAYARGYGGQMLYVVPERELTVAITSDPTRPARSAGYAGALKRFVSNDIIPAVEQR
ncbi:MAG: serine hydrolase [Pseudomonadota bacterium]